jgi:flagellar biosynthetic protein FliQ
MSEAMVLELARRAVLQSVLLGGPLLLAALVVGLVLSIIQAVTQIQEQTLTFVIKLIAVGAVFLVALPWLLQTAVKYTIELFHTLPSLVS